MGDASKAAWESMNSHYEEMEELDRAKTGKNLEAEYETLPESESDHPNDEQYKQLAEDQANWNSFLDSF